MSRVYCATLALLLLLILIPGPLLFAAAVAGDHVVTTDRLNVRACPATAGCRVLLTLPAESELSVLEGRGDWLRVASLDGATTGWVSANYTRIVETSAPKTGRFAALPVGGTLGKLFVSFCLLSGLAIMAAVGRRQRPKATNGELIALAAISGLTGVFVVLNQFGPALAKLAATQLDLQEVSFLWEINSIGEGCITYPRALLFLGIVTVGVAAAAPAANGGRLSFTQGFLAGFLALPALGVAIALIGVVIYLLGFVFRLLGYLLGILLIPFVWLVQHVFYPLIRFLAIPFVWLWEHALRDLVLFLSIPFVWLWNAILHPIGAFLLKYILRPAFILVLGVVIATACTLPFVVIGGILLESIRSSVGGSLKAQGLFSQGVVAGYLLLDTIVLAVLTGREVLQTAPPITLALPAGLLVIVLLRLLVSRDRETVAEPRPGFKERARSYWNSSSLELVSACLMIPLSIAANFYSEDG